MARRRKGRAVSGWLILDKDPGMTSTQAVAAVRRLFDAAKAGHAGTLDPMATGVLPIALGEATKTVPFVVDAPKTYRFTVRWGVATDTDDAEGRVIADSAHRPSAAAIEAALAAFTGVIAQRPPTYAAIKVDGERAYARARRGEALALATREVVVHALSLLEVIDADHAAFEVRCGKGTYVRALARDLAAHLGTVGHVSALRRTAVGRLRAERAISLAKLADVVHKSAPCGPLLPVEAALDDIPALALTGDEASRVRSGQPVAVAHRDPGLVALSAHGRLLAVAEVKGGSAHPVRVFNL